MSTLQNITTATPDGDFHIIFDEMGIARASGFGRIEELRKRLPEELRGVTVETVRNHPYEKLVQEYYRGGQTALNAIPRSQDGTDFQKTVWDIIGSIPYGKTISYKELAERSGNPAAVRAAGTICGLNRLILLIPCHRVMKSDGGLGGYLYGKEIKTSLLRHEHAL